MSPCTEGVACTWPLVWNFQRSVPVFASSA